MAIKASKALKANLAARSDWREADWFVKGAKARDRRDAKRVAKRAARRLAREILTAEILVLVA